MRVEATISDVAWRTSVFPQKAGGYILPVKAEVRRRAGIAAGDDVTVELDCSDLAAQGGGGGLVASGH